MDQIPDTPNIDPFDHVALMEAIVKARSRSAFAALFDDIAPKLKAFYRKGGLEQSVAEDLVQDVMLTVWRLGDRYDPERANPATWIFTIARNRLIDHARRQKVRQGDLTDPSLQPAPVEPSDDLIDRQQRYSSLKNAMATLPKEQADLLRMAFFEHQSHSEIASTSGLPLGTVKSRIRLAVKRLRGDLAARLGETS